MRVLMFGWEFPPYISGGLGSACEGMVRALTGRGTQVIFVVPKLLSGEGADEPGGLSMRSASGIVVPGGGVDPKRKSSRTRGPSSKRT